MPEIGGSYFTFSNENNDLIWGFLRSATGAAGSTRATTRCRGARAAAPGYQPDGDERGLPGPRGPGPDRPLPAASTGPARVAARLDDDALDADLERRRGRRAGPALRRASARATTSFWLGKGTLKHARSIGPFEVARGAAGRGPGRLALRRARSTTCRPSATAFAERHARRRRRRRTSTASSPWNEVGEDEGTGIVHIAPGCGAEDFQLGKELGLPVDRAARRGRASTSRASAG